MRSLLRPLTSPLAVDAGLAALLNAGLLVAAGRFLAPLQLSEFATVQLVVTSAVAIQRAAVLQSALATQRSVGRRVVPARWIISIALPIAAVVGFVCLAVGVPPLRVVLIVLVAFGLLAADILRFRCFTVDSGRIAAIGSASGVGVCLLSLSLASLLGRPLRVDDFLLAWLLSAVAVVGAIALLGRRVRGHHLEFALGPTLRLGAWSGGDVALSSLANLLPIILVSFALQSSLAGQYRVLQAALGPLNIASTVLLTTVGLSTWTLVSVEALGRMRRQVFSNARKLAIVSLCYLSVATAVIVGLTGIWTDDSPRILIIVIFTGVIGAFGSSFGAGALALGKQKAGFLIRIGVIAASVLLTVGAARTNLVPFNDPIGSLALLSTCTNCIVWFFVFIQSWRTASKALANSRRGG